jgi:ATP-dependent DNA helicase RecG
MRILVPGQKSSSICGSVPAMVVFQNLRMNARSVLPSARHCLRQSGESMSLATRSSSSLARYIRTLDVGVGELDHAEITRTIDEGIRRQRLDEPGTRDPEVLLRGLGLMRADRILNAAVVLFGRPEAMGPEYSQCLLRMARFRGKDKTEFDDNRQEVGNIFLLFQVSQRFLRDHLPVAGRVLPGVFEREDDTLFPPSALREALANAFCHRDYRIPGGSVSIGIYDDRLEITSTGNLPPGLTPADLLLPHTSRPRNPTIAGTLYRRGIIEQWGRGTIKIAELTTQAGLVRPEFEERGGEVVVRFFPEGYVPPPRADHELTSRQQEILKLLGELGPVPSSLVRPRLSKRTSENALLLDLKLLRHLGLVRKTGRTRNARWHLTGHSGSDTLRSQETPQQ